MTTLNNNHTRPRDISLEIGTQETTLRRSLYHSLLRAIEGAAEGPLRVLDIGCGRGELMGLLTDRGHSVTGIDLEPECVRLSSSYGRAIEGGFCEIDQLFRPGDFDVVVSSHVLEHVDNPLASLTACRWLLVNRYVFAVPNVHRCSRMIRTGLGRSRPDHPTHVFGWGRPEFEALLLRAGFGVRHWHTDRVTINPFGGAMGDRLSRLMHPIETIILPRLFPLLSSSLIVECCTLDSFIHEISCPQ